jgi:fatty-acyl-CoA synthase/long-chain acyl-CoA synthetase
MSDDLAIDHRCLGEALEEAGDRLGDRIGWTFEDEHVSFAQMQDNAAQVADSLLALGVEAGDIVAVWISNLKEFASCLFGCARIGAVLTAINTRSKLFELEHILGHSGAKVVILTDRFLNQDFIGMIRDVMEGGAIASGGAVRSARFPRLQQLVADPSSSDDGLMAWRDFIALGDRARTAGVAVAPATRQRTEPVLLQYTSGTTALPKGALCNHTYVLNFGRDNVARMGVRPGEAILSTQPFYHVGGSCGAVTTPLTTECRFVIPRLYEPERVLRLIERERCVARTGFAAMYLMEMDHPRFRQFDLSSLRSGWCVGAPEVMEQIRDRMNLPGLIQIYGATEACGSSGSIGEPWEQRSRTCGRAFSAMELAIVDPETGAPAPAGGSGEIVMRGWCTMNGYLNQPEETARTIDAAGWVHSGDYGMIDDQGYLHFQGRLKNMIRVGGENVAAEEVEAMLLRHPKIRMAAAIPTPDPRLEEVVLAIVELKQGEEATESDIIAFCKSRMANFRVPRIVRFIEEWPMTGSGKIQKHVLIEQYSRPAAAVGGN